MYRTKREIRSQVMTYGAIVCNNVATHEQNKIYTKTKRMQIVIKHQLAAKITIVTKTTTYVKRIT